MKSKAIEIKNEPPCVNLAPSLAYEESLTSRSPSIFRASLLSSSQPDSWSSRIESVIWISQIRIRETTLLGYDCFLLIRVWVIEYRFQLFTVKNTLSDFPSLNSLLCGMVLLLHSALHSLFPSEKEMNGEDLLGLVLAGRWSGSSMWLTEERGHPDWWRGVQSRIPWRNVAVPQWICGR